MRGSALLLAAVLLAPAARAASTFDLSVDPRLELLGVVQHLAGYGKTAAAFPGYARDVDEHFGRFKDHPAVRLYREVYRRDPGRDGFGIELLYYGPPPALGLERRASMLPYVQTEDQQQIASRFLEELRDFADVSDFVDFFKAHEDFYREVVRAERPKLGPREPIALLEDYLGVGLESRCHYYLTPLYLNTYHSSFIDPYPDPDSLKGAAAAPFEIWTVVPDEIGGDAPPGQSALRGVLWHEPLYVFVDPSVRFFEAANIQDPAAFYGARTAACRVEAANCVKRVLVAALTMRLDRKAGASVIPPEGSPDFLRAVDAMSKRLEEYEAERGRYPTLWDFYPRLFSVFHELAFPGEAPPVLRPGPGVRRVPDFFAPEFRARVKAKP